MSRQSVLEYFQQDSRPHNETAVVFRRGYRMVRWSYSHLYRAGKNFAALARSHGVSKGDRVLIWGENSGEWIAAFLGCLFCGAVAVPMDAISDKAFARRVAQQAGVRIAVAARNLPPLNLPITTIAFEDIGEPIGKTEDFVAADARRDEPFEIVFTSGTTTEPRGVVLTHGNILANLEPIEKEIKSYRSYERVFHPLRFLELVPLSHVFGQLLGIFIPQILGATSVFPGTLNPADILDAIHEERISVLITVPRLIESLRDQLERGLASSARLEKFRSDFSAAEHEHFLKRWWRFRRIHKRLGWKFWAIISGGAALPADAEMFWARLGYAVIQGYGLTETTSLVSLNHPFRIGQRSIGKVLPGLELRLAEDGEILVRGENVAHAYLTESRLTDVLDKNGWFHTGDIAERDSAGNYYFKGRRKNVIVTPEGLNVYPEDLENELRKESGLRDCVVVGLDLNGNAVPCAALLLRDSSRDSLARADGIVSHANTRLAPFQQIRHWLVWPDQDFPRTPTQKPVLSQIKQAAEAQLGVGKMSPGVFPATRPLKELLHRIGGGHALGGSDHLQLSSIERVELMSALEDRYQIDVSESEFTAVQTVGELERLIERPSAQSRVYHYPRWAQSWPIRIVRAAVFNLLARPAMLLLGWPGVTGRQNLSGLSSAALVISNHVAFFDPAYIMEALPSRFRRKLAIAMDGELLESMRNPLAGTPFFRGMADRAAYWLVVSVYNVFPLPLHAGFRKSFAFAGELVDRGWSVLVFPEGTRTRDGKLSPFRAGIGLLAARLNVPVVPMRLNGIFELKSAGARWARPGQIGVAIGSPVRFQESDDPERIARELEQRVAELAN